MKKQIRVKRIIVLITVAGIIAAFCWYFGLFTSYNYFSAKQDIRAGKIRFITFGLPATPSLNSPVDSLQKKYGVNYYNIGCSISSDDELRGIKFYNSVVETYLEKRNGKNWRADYHKQLDSIRRIK